MTHTKKLTRKQFQNYVLAGEAASILGVSIDTVRRWEKQGILQAVRLDGRNRYFDVDKLESHAANLPLTTSQVAHLLSISVSSVRRLEELNLLIPQRNDNKIRMYNRSDVESYRTKISNVPQVEQNFNDPIGHTSLNPTKIIDINPVAKKSTDNRYVTPIKPLKKKKSSVWQKTVEVLSIILSICIMVLILSFFLIP